VFRGSTTYLPDWDHPVESEAASELISRAMKHKEEDEPLYVVAIGAITNVASAILMEPEIIKRIVVVWLGGNPHYWPHTREFNLEQDLPAARVIFDSGVPLVHIPCQGVVTHLHTTIAELERHVLGKSEIGDYLTNIVKSYHTDHYAWSKVIWDISTIAYLINPDWTPSNLIHSPILTDQVTWSQDNQRHFIRSAYYVKRDEIFGDLFAKLAAHKIAGIK
jgi:purine nucleosidase